jgi:hypothetical protein
MRKIHVDAAERMHAARIGSMRSGECLREEIEHVREGRHGARPGEQAIASGWFEVCSAGVKMPLGG